MQLLFKALSLSYENANVEWREKVYLSTESCANLSRRIQGVLDLEEVLVLSTCNRTEVYYVSDEDVADKIITLLLNEKGIFSVEEWFPRFLRFDAHTDALAHLFEVSMGLRSQVIGDLQISNQVKKAYSMAAELKLAGPIMHRLLHTIFHANKRVQQETAYRDGAASVSYAAAQLAKDLVAMISEPSILVIGMGEMGEDVARNLADGKFAKVVLMNRSPEKAKTLAAELGVETLPFESLSEVAQQFTAIVSAVSTEEPILTSKMLSNTKQFEQHFMIDLSLPRSIDPSVEELSGVLMYSIDEIQAKTDETLKKRLKAADRVREIIAEEMAGFGNWSMELSISPTIQKLKEALEQIRKDELARYLKNANDEESKLLEKATTGMMNKIMKLPVLQLKAACKRGEQETLIGLLNDLFDLEKEKTTTKA